MSSFDFQPGSEYPVTIDQLEAGFSVPVNAVNEEWFHNREHVVRLELRSQRLDEKASDLWEDITREELEASQSNHDIRKYAAKDVSGFLYAKEASTLALSSLKRFYATILEHRSDHLHRLADRKKEHINKLTINLV
ncbi:MAG: hypothetical protein WDN66_04305 [Candidatus Saccharibacteria bacterium]